MVEVKLLYLFETFFWFFKHRHTSDECSTTHFELDPGRAWDRNMSELIFLALLGVYLRLMTVYKIVDDKDIA